VDDITARGRQIRPAPAVARARLLARARATVAAERSAPAAPVLATSSSRGGRRVAVAAAILLALGTAGTAAALYTRAARLDARAPAPLRPGEIVDAPRVAAPVRPVEPEADLAAPAPAARPHRSHGPLTPQESYAAELSLLQRAQAAYAGQDFPDALVLVAEHARRFPRGRLAEEREALRVRSLAGASRGQEARRALAAFARRFPRSVLLPRLQEAARTAED
jgi:hypothetical protein